MYEKILVPLDGSDLAEMALPSAQRFAAKLGSDITLIYVSKSEKNPNAKIDRTYLEQTVQKTKAAADALLAQSGGEGVNVHYAMLCGDPAEQIVDYADQEDIGLITMATLGRSGINRWTLGSVADRVVRATKRPTFLIRANIPNPDYVQQDISYRGKILVSLDGSKESEAILPHVEELAVRLQSDVILLEVRASIPAAVVPSAWANLDQLEEQAMQRRTAAEDYLASIAKGLEEKGLTVRTEVRFGNPAEEIITFAEEIPAGLVAMSTHGRSGIARWALGSVADRVLRRGTKPLLLVRPPKAK